MDVDFAGAGLLLPRVKNSAVKHPLLHYYVLLLFNCYYTYRCYHCYYYHYSSFGGLHGHSLIADVSCADLCIELDSASKLPLTLIRKHLVALRGGVWWYVESILLGIN